MDRMTPPEEYHVYRERIGAFVLGKLDGAELEAVRAHLDGCADCRTEARELEPVVAALADADPDRIDEYPRPPDGLEESTLAPIFEEMHRAQSSRRPYGWARLAAAAIFALIIGLAGINWLVEPAAALEPLAFTTAPDVKPVGYLIAHAWGTEIRLGASGLRDGQTYRVTLVSEDGKRVNAGTFIGAGDELSRGKFTAALSREDAARLEVRAPGGELAFFSKLPEKPRDKVRAWPLFGVLPWAEPDLKDKIMNSRDSEGKKGPGAEDTSPSDSPETPTAYGSGGGTPPDNESPPESDSGGGFHGTPPSESPSAAPEPPAAPEPSAPSEPPDPPEPSAPPEPPDPNCSQYSPNGQCP